MVLITKRCWEETTRWAAVALPIEISLIPRREREAVSTEKGLENMLVLPTLQWEGIHSTPLSWTSIINALCDPPRSMDFKPAFLVYSQNRTKYFLAHRSQSSSYTDQSSITGLEYTDNIGISLPRKRSSKRSTGTRINAPRHHGLSHQFGRRASSEPKTRRKYSDSRLHAWLPARQYSHKIIASRGG